MSRWQRRIPRATPAPAGSPGRCVRPWRVVVPDTRRRLLLASNFALLALCGVLLAVVTSRPPRDGAGNEAPGGAPASQEPRPPEVAPAEGPVGASERATPAAPRPPEQQAPELLRLPDGTAVAPLNGVQRAGPFVWGEGPYAPIVGTETQNGIEWWVHADGTKSTTLMIWRKELGRADATTVVARPVAPVPVEGASGR